MIASNIQELADHAKRFNDVDENIVSRRIAYILVIHAMDEAGKLLSIIKNGIAAESEGTDSISIQGFYSHPVKGSEAGSMGIVAVDWLQKVAAAKSDSIGEDKGVLQDYRIHLETLRQDFRCERERTLYVDYACGKWISPSSAEYNYVCIDAFLLDIMALFVKANIEAGLSFCEIDEIVRDIYNSVDLDDLG